MSQDHTHFDTSTRQDALADLPRTSLNRRQMLCLLAAGGATVVGGAALAACGGNTGTTVTPVTLYAPGWPVDVAAPKAKQLPGTWEKAYATMLNEWLGQNPGVTIKSSSVLTF